MTIHGTLPSLLLIANAIKLGMILSNKRSLPQGLYRTKRTLVLYSLLLKKTQKSQCRTLKKDKQQFKLATIGLE